MRVQSTENHQFEYISQQKNDYKQTGLKMQEVSICAEDLLEASRETFKCFHLNFWVQVESYTVRKKDFQLK